MTTTLPPHPSPLRHDPAPAPAGDAPTPTGEVPGLLRRATRAARAWELLDQERVDEVVAPAALGAIGGICNGLTPSLTLGCGAFGHTSVSDNVSARHLLDIKHVARPTAPATARA